MSANPLLPLRETMAAQVSFAIHGISHVNNVYKIDNFFTGKAPTVLTGYGLGRGRGRGRDRGVGISSIIISLPELADCPGNNLYAANNYFHEKINF